MISQLCQKKSVRLILLNTPEHKYLTTNLGKDIEEDWAFVRQTLPMDSLLDLSETALPDSCFGDTQHLSRKGAEVFSRYLCDKIQSAKGSMEHEHALYRRPVDR